MSKSASSQSKQPSKSKLPPPPPKKPRTKSPKSQPQSQSKPSSNGQNNNGKQQIAAPVQGQHQQSKNVQPLQQPQTSTASKRQKYVKKSMDAAAGRPNEKWLKIPVDYASASLTDFRGLMAKQRSLLSDGKNDINYPNDSGIFSRSNPFILYLLSLCKDDNKNNTKTFSDLNN